MKTTLTNKLKFFSALFIAPLLLTACGTTTGNGRITVETASYSTAGFVNSFGALYSTNITDFKLCVKKIQLINEQDETKKKDGEEEISFPVGLVDLSSGESTSWGTVEVPIDFMLKRVKIHIHKDSELCGVNYSAKFNSFESTQNLVIKYVFDTAIDLSAGDVVQLDMETMARALRSASDGGSLNNNTLRDKMEAVESAASKKKKK